MLASLVDNIVYYTWLAAARSNLQDASRKPRHGSHSPDSPGLQSTTWDYFARTFLSSFNLASDALVRVAGERAACHERALRQLVKQRTRRPLIMARCACHMQEHSTIRAPITYSQSLFDEGVKQ